MMMMMSMLLLVLVVIHSFPLFLVVISTQKAQSEGFLLFTSVPPDGLGETIIHNTVVELLRRLV